MAFKKSDLKNWTVKRTIELVPGANFSVDIKVLSEKDGMAIVEQGTDLQTVKGFVAGVSDYQDDKGKDMSLPEFFDDVATLPPTVIHKIALECVNAQHDAAIKN